MSAHEVSERRAPATAKGGSLISIHQIDIDGVQVFYRQAGPEDAPVLLLLHGYPSSSFQFRELMPLLADRYRLIAPDLPSFGFTKVPASTNYTFDFAHLAETVCSFTEKLGLDHFAMYIFDYGAPVGLRMAIKHPERIAAIISQNGNAYEQGIGPEWAPAQRYWKEQSLQNRDALKSWCSYEVIKELYLTTPDPDQVKPEGYTLDAELVNRPGNLDVQLNLILDYRNNIAMYPEFQGYFREHKPPTLCVWGSDDKFFPPAGAEAFKIDNPSAQVHLLPAGHFALETKVGTIAALIRPFLDEYLSK